LAGTAYLFTQEAVESGAIQTRFQDAALSCERTVTLEASVGYATRCLPSPFVETFEAEKKRLVLANTPLEQMKENLEVLNIGRLRIASKGVDRNPAFGTEARAPYLLPVEADKQWQQGMYMIGQVAALRDEVVSIAQLHEDLCAGS